MIKKYGREKMQNTNYSCHEGLPPILITIFDKFNFRNNFSFDAREEKFLFCFISHLHFCARNDPGACEGGGKNN